MLTQRFERQIRLFGLEGQQLIMNATVGIVGLGGLGSHVAQQLAYLGIQSFKLWDHDVVSESNLNRLVGASHDDAKRAEHKVNVASRLIRQLTASAEIESYPEHFISENAVRRIAQCDVLFGCIDQDAARLILNEICQAYRVPYLDLATEIHSGQAGSIAFGGRVHYSIGGESCVVCMDLLNRDAMRDAFMSDSERHDRDVIYGIPRGELNETGPAVVSLNGILASVAVTELMVDLTGIRKAQRLLEYNGLRGILTSSLDQPTPDCYYCKGAYGGMAVDLSQYRGYADRLAMPE